MIARILPPGTGIAHQWGPAGGDTRGSVYSFVATMMVARAWGLFSVSLEAGTWFTVSWEPRQVRLSGITARPEGWV